MNHVWGEKRVPTLHPKVGGSLIFTLASGSSFRHTTGASCGLAGRDNEERVVCPRPHSVTPVSIGVSRENVLEQ